MSSFDSVWYFIQVCVSIASRIKQATVQTILVVHSTLDQCSSTLWIWKRRVLFLKYFGSSSV